MNKLKKILFQGIALAIPLSVVAYVFLKINRGFEKLMGPVAAYLGIERLLGELTITFLAILCILLLTLLLGILMNLAFISSFHHYLEEQILNFFPWLNQLKIMAAENLELDEVSNTWEPVLLHCENEYFLAFLIEATDSFASFYLVKGTKTDDGEIMITERNKVKYYPISSRELRSVAKRYGKGMIALIEKVQQKGLT